jgi:tetratricopeptide (TPR) repeat protein
MRRWKTAFGLALMVPLLSAASAWAENEGLAELDRATQLKITADTFDDLAAVIEHAEAALEQGLNEENAAFAKALLASAHYERGAVLSAMIFGEEGADPRWPQLRRLALPELEKALELRPNQPRASFLLARLQTLPGGDRDAALKALDAVIAAKEVEPAILVKSYPLRAGLQVEDAKRLADFNKAIELAPDQPGALRARGLFYLVKENVKGAIADLQKAAELEPGDVPTIEALSLALMMDKQFDAALKHLNEAIRLSPDSSTLYANRARLYIAEKQLDKALADLDKAITRQPSSLPTLLLRARVHAQTGDVQKALGDVSQALAMRPG